MNISIPKSKKTCGELRENRGSYEWDCGIAKTTAASIASDNTRIRLENANKLKMRDCQWFRSSFNRPNLKYTILRRKFDEKITVEQIIEMIRKDFPMCSGIVYCHTKKL